MKTIRVISTTVLLAMISLAVLGQNKKMQYFRYPDQTGINVFETSKIQEDEEEVEEAFEGLKVRVGGNYSVLFQGLSQENDFGGDVSVPDGLVNLSNNFALPTANLNLDIQLDDGLRMHIRTYLSSRNHNESWVKGGYFQLDKLDFIKEGFLSGFMEMATIRFGMDDINYGDAHFRRSDNSASIYNPFVGNYIMDAFTTTEPFGELTIQKSGFLGVIGLSNGKLNQSPLEGDDGFVLYTKLGYDKQMNDDLRVRFTGSLYSSNDRSTRDYLYNGDRAGARYYNVLEGENDSRVSAFLPRFNTGFGYQTAIQFNPFIKFKGLEFFGIVEVTNNGDDAIGGSYTQLGGEAIYRFGGREQLFVGARLNSVKGEASDVALTNEINRTNIGGGWFLTKNILAKVEYVTHSYSGEAFDATKFQGAKFDGIAIEAVISF